MFIEFIEEPTVQSCINLYNIEGMTTIINDGKILGFKEEIPTQTANPSGDK